MVFLIVFVAYTAWRGIELSVKLIIGLGLIEGLIVLALGLWGLADPGSGGTTFREPRPEADRAARRDGLDPDHGRVPDRRLVGTDQRLGY
jgi:hypothetical protein